MKRNARQFVRQAITPDLYHSPTGARSASTPPTPQSPAPITVPESILPKGTCELCSNRITAGYLELSVNMKCDLAAAKRQIERLQHDLHEAQRALAAEKQGRTE